MAAHQFCRDVCLERGEPLVGTGTFSARAILVAWPRGKWRVPRFESVDMGPALSDAIRLAMKAGIHVALVDRVGETDAIDQLHADGISANFDSEDEIAEAITRFTAGEKLVGRPDPRPIILCCTDSRRDACCARFGFATFKALRASADPAEFNLLQCTHVGGCRFAASLVVLPQRQRYGRLEPDQVPAFLDALARGETYLPAFRGRTDIPDAAQVAEHAALHWAQEHGLPTDDIELGETLWPDDGDGTAGEEILREVRSGTTRLRISLQARLIEQSGRCTVVDEPPDIKPRWHLSHIEPIT